MNDNLHIDFTIPFGFIPLEDRQGDPIPCPLCQSDNTYGDWETDTANDGEKEVEVHEGQGFCANCGHRWKL